MKYASLLLACSLVTTSVYWTSGYTTCVQAAERKAAERKAAPRRVAVAQFDAPTESRARNEILTTLSDHDDVEVVSLDDIVFTSKRIKADPTTPEGRKKIATELGVEAWIDGKVDGTSAHLKLTSAAGRRITEVDVHAATERLLDVLAGEKMWTAMGPSLSDRENKRRALLMHADLARTKIEDRKHELDRQRSVARQHATERVERLKAERERAREKQAAIAAELARQEKLVQDRLAQAAQEQEQTDERRRRSEMRRLAQSAPVQPAASMGYAQPRRTDWGAARAPYAGGYTPVPAAPDPAGAAVDPAQASATGVSSATQRWLASQQMPAGSVPAAQPVAQPVAPAALPEPAPIDTAGGSVSPATQRWLAEQQQRQR
jgi:hypothetical protein